MTSAGVDFSHIGVLRAIRRGARLKSGMPRLEKVLAALELRGWINLFPKPHLTERGEKKLRLEAA